MLYPDMEKKIFTEINVVFLNINNIKYLKYI